MHVEFNLAPADWSAFGEYQVRNLRTMRRDVLRAQLGVGAFLLVVTLGLVFLAGFWPWAAVVLAGGLLAILDMPRQIRGRVRKQMAALFDEGRNPCVRGLHRLEATPEGLASKCDASQSLTNWNAIEGVAETSSHTFLLFGGGRGLVIPRGGLVSGDLAAFSTEVRQRSSAVAV